MTCRDVYLRDIASVNCSDENLTARLNAMKVYKFRQDAQKGKNGENRTVISILYLISKIEQAEKNVQVESLGEQDMLVQMVEPEKGRIWKRAQIVLWPSIITTTSTSLCWRSPIPSDCARGSSSFLTISGNAGSQKTRRRSRSRCSCMRKTWTIR